MSTSFVGVAVQWAPENSPLYKVKIVNGELVAEDESANIDFTRLHLNKSAEMIAAGKMVKGSIAVGRWGETSKYPTNLPEYFIECGPVANDSIISNNAGEISSAPSKDRRSAIRLFVDESAANEWITFVLSHNALTAIILTEEELFGFLPDFPSDDVIRQYVVTQ